MASIVVQRVKTVANYCSYAMFEYYVFWGSGPSSGSTDTLVCSCQLAIATYTQSAQHPQPFIDPKYLNNPQRRCVVGFALLNVVSSVFVSQTLLGLTGFALECI